jgi:hypothetical protein
VGLEPTRSALRERRPTRRAAPALQYPRQESNLHHLRLRRAACLRHTPGMSFSCGGWIRTTVIRVQSPAFVPLNYPAIHRTVARAGLEPARRGGHGVLSAACLPFHHLAIQKIRNTNIEIRNKRTKPVPWVGFEPTISTVRGWRPLRAGTARAPAAEGEGVEPSRATGLVPFRAGCHRHLACPSSSPIDSLDGWIRTSVARLPKPVDEPLSYIQIAGARYRPAKE